MGANVGDSDDGFAQGLPSFGSHDGGVILRAGINHYKAILPVIVDVLTEIEVLVEIVRVRACLDLALRRRVGRLINASGLGLTGGNLTN